MPAPPTILLRVAHQSALPKNPPPPSSSSEAPASSSSEEPVSSSSEAPSSSSAGIPDNDYLIEYQDFETPKGYNLSQDEWDLLISEAAFNQTNVRGRNTVSSEETSDYGVRNPAETAIRSYEGLFQESHWDFYDGRIATYSLDTEEYSTEFGGTYNDLYEEEIFFIQGNAEDGFGLYFNHSQTENGIAADPYTTEYTTSETLEENLWDAGPVYDSSIVYYNAFSYNYIVNLCFSPDNYDPTSAAYIRAEDGTIYQTNYSSGTSSEAVEVDGVEIQAPHHYVSGTQFVFSKVDGLGYCLTKYTTMSMDYLSVDYYGNRLDEPIVVHKDVTTTDWDYAAAAPKYEGEAPSVITPVEDAYAVSLDNYDTYSDPMVVSDSVAFDNVTGLYKQFIDPEFEGYAYRYVNYAGGAFKVSVTGPEGYTPLTLGWNEITDFEDYSGYVYESEELENGIQDDGYGYVSYMVLLNADGSLAKFVIAFLI